MKYVRQFLIIIAVCFLGELLKFAIPLPIPAGIYGMILLFAALQLRIIKVESIGETARFLIEIMPVMFLPAGVGLITSWDALQSFWIQLIVISIVSTVIVMAVSGVVTQIIMRKGKK